MSPVAKFHHVLEHGFVIHWLYGYQMSLSQSDLSILHESIVYCNIILSCKIVDSDRLKDI